MMKIYRHGQVIIGIIPLGKQETVLRTGIEFLRDITVYDEDLQARPGNHRNYSIRQAGNSAAYWDRVPAGHHSV